MVIFIKNNKFDRAKEVLNKHFPKALVGKVSSITIAVAVIQMAILQFMKVLIN